MEDYPKTLREFDKRFSTEESCKSYYRYVGQKALSAQLLSLTIMEH